MNSKFLNSILLLFVLSLPVYGQTSEPGALGTKIPWLDIGISHRTRYEALDNRFRLGETGSDQQLPQRTRVRFEIQRVLPFGFVMEFEDARVHLDDSGSTVNNTMEDENDITNLYINFVQKNPGNTNLTGKIYIGRQTFDLGSRRFLARNRFRNATNSFDAIRWTLGSEEKNWELTAFVSRPVLRQMHQPDRPDPTGAFWGAFLSAEFLPQFKNEFYYFGVRESQTSPKSKKRQHSTLGTRLFKEPKTGSVSYEFETAIQFGKIGDLNHLAHFEHISADYSFNAPWRPKLTGRYDYASGTKDPGSQDEGAFDTLFGARRFEFGPTGIYGAIARSNINSPGWAVAVNPMKKLKIMSAMRWVWLASSRDQWAGTKLKDLTGNSGSYIGSLFELQLNYKLNKYIDAETGYSHLIKGSYLDKVPGSPGSEDSNYFYVQTSIEFEHFLRAF